MIAGFTYLWSATYGDPAYNYTGILPNTSWDVYSFGVVLFEVLCRRAAYINVNKGQSSLARQAERYYREGRLREILDVDLLINPVDWDSLNRFSKIVYVCLKTDPKERPSMGLVVKELEQILKLQKSLQGFVQKRSNLDEPSYFADSG